MNARAKKIYKQASKKVEASIREVGRNVDGESGGHEYYEGYRDGIYDGLKMVKHLLADLVK